MGVKLHNEHWYKHVPESVAMSHDSKVTIMWNQPMQINRAITSNKPDNITCDNEKWTCMLIDVAISGDKNVIKKLRRF